MNNSTTYNNSESMTSETTITTTSGVPLRKPLLTHSSKRMNNSNSSTTTKIGALSLSDKKKQQPLEMTNANWSVERIPVFYPLARSSLAIPSAISLETTVTRMTLFLRIRSIKCTFHPQSGRVDCLSSSMLKFVLQLWRSESDSDSSSFILEVQRRRGCSMEMKSLCKGLFHAVVNGQLQHRQNTPLVVKTQMQRRPKLRRNNNHCNGNVSCPKLDVNDILSNCLQWLDSPFQEQNKLGMERLRNSTDANIVRPDVAKSVSKAILLGKGNLPNQIRNHLVRWTTTSSVVSMPVPGGSQHNNNTEEENCQCNIDDEDNNKLHWNAMQSLSQNVLTNVLHEGGNDEEGTNLWLSTTASLVQDQVVDSSSSKRLGPLLGRQGISYTRRSVSDQAVWYGSSVGNPERI